MYKLRQQRLSAFALAFSALSSVPARAQTTTANPPATLPDTPPRIAPNPAPAQNAAPGNTRREQRLRERREQLQNMTPEERQELMRRNRETSTRRLLERAGVTDAATQNSVIKYVSDEQEAREKSRVTIRNASQKLAQAVRTGAVTEAQLATLLGEFQNAAADEKERRAATAAELDRQIGYSSNPRLEAVLTTLGAIGDENLYLVGGIGGGFAAPRGGTPRAGATRPNGLAQPRGALRPGLRNGLRTPATPQGGPTTNGLAQPATP